MHVDKIGQGRAGSVDALEALNAVMAEKFRGLPDDVPLWRFREVLTKLGTELGLTGGAVVYALDLMGLLTEADWRGDGRPITYHSIRTYARKVGKAERTIYEYERQLVLAGIAHRTLKHARRHSGMGNDARRTGLDWRAFGARLPDFLVMLEKRRAREQHRLNLETRVRTARRTVLGLLDAVADRVTLADMEAQYTAADVARLRRSIDILGLERRLAALLLLKEQLVAVLDDGKTVDNEASSEQPAVQSADSGRLIDTTDISPCPSDIRSGRFGKKPNTGSKEAGNDRQATPNIEITRRTGTNITVSPLPPLEEIWKAVPETWRKALGPDTPVSWSILIDLAGNIGPRLGVSPCAWQEALRVLGPSEASLALAVLDRNRDHPLRPVHNVGGALMGMIRRARKGDFNLGPSIYGMIGRSRGEGRVLCRTFQ